MTEIIKMYDEDSATKKGGEGAHDKNYWVDAPPNTWHDFQTREYDMLLDLEMKLKSEILKTLGATE